MTNELFKKVLNVSNKTNKYGRIMKQYSVYCKSANFSEVYFTLTSAKKAMRELIRKGHEDVRGSITKIWSNGDWENLGKINLNGSNRTFVANTRQKTRSYN